MIGRRCRRGPAILLTMGLATACNGGKSDTGPEPDADGIYRDDEGCWVSGHQAWEAIMVERQCDQSCGWAAEESVCKEAQREAEVLHREAMCFDGCAVDACLAALDAAIETCDTEAVMAANSACIVTGPNTAFWSAANEERPYGDSCIGW